MIVGEDYPKQISYLILTLNHDEIQVRPHYSLTLSPKVDYLIQSVVISAQIRRKAGIFEPKDVRKLLSKEFFCMVLAVIYFLLDLYTLENNFESI